MFAHAQEHIFAAQQFKDIVPLFGEGNFEIAPRNIRLVRFDAV